MATQYRRDHPGGEGTVGCPFIAEVEAAELASFCTMGSAQLALFGQPAGAGPRRQASRRRTVPNPQSKNWLCFARLGLRVSVRPLEIGFVFPRLSAGPTHHNSFSAKYLPFPSTPGQLALFRTIRPRRPKAAGPGAGVPPQICPQSAIEELGSFCTIDIVLEWWNDRTVECWVFHQPTLRHRLGVPLRAIGFVCTIAHQLPPNAYSLMI